MRYRNLVFIFLCVVISIKVVAQPHFKIVGYYPIRAAQNIDVKDVPFKYLTHINLAFLNPDSLGNFIRDLSGLKPLIEGAHKKQVKVLFSIAGGGRHPQYHYLLKDEQRSAFIDNLMTEALKYNVDGIDVDLEGRDIDENYEKFVIELAERLREQGKLITAAIAVYYKDQLTDQALSQYDFVNIMSYDRTGPWRPERPGPHSTYDHAVEDLNYFASEREISKEKMTLGVPFYGYGFGPELDSKAISMNYHEIITTFPGAEKVDELSMPDGKILYFNGIPTIKKKTELAMEKASGIMIWQIRGDAKGSKSLLKAIYKMSKKY